MGLLDDGASIISRRSSHHGSKHHSSNGRDKEYKFVRKDRSRSRDQHGRHDRHRSRSRSRARSAVLPGVSARSLFGLDNSSRRSHHSNRHNKSTASFFSLPNVSSRSIFGTFAGGHSSSSYYRRSPRASFMQRAYRKLKRLLRDLVYYAKKHPWRVFILAIMPLITGGALTALLARFGLRMPPAFERMLGVGARAMSGDSMGLVSDAVRGMAAGGAASKFASFERGYSGGPQRERRNERDYFGGDQRRREGGWGESLSRWFS